MVDKMQEAKGATASTGRYQLAVISGLARLVLLDAGSFPKMHSCFNVFVLRVASKKRVAVSALEGCPSQLVHVTMRAVAVG